MFCSYCGSEVRQGSMFCSKCGSDLRDQDGKQEEGRTESVMEDLPVQAGQDRTPKKRFGKEEQLCSICGKNLTFTALRDGYICPECQNKTLITDPSLLTGRVLSNLTIEKVRELMRAQGEFDERKQKFLTSDGVASCFAIDKTNRLFEAFFNRTAVCMSWDELIAFELLEDGKVINKHGVGGAVVGGVLLGGTGAVIGHAAGSRSKEKATQIAVKIVTRNEYYPQIVVDLINSNVKKGSRAYRIAQENAQKILSMLTIISDSVQNRNNDMASLSPAEEIKKYKNLLDDGIISREEFDTKKSQLMGI